MPLHLKKKSLVLVPQYMSYNIENNQILDHFTIAHTFTIQF